MSAATLQTERHELLADLHEQLPELTNRRAIERTRRAIERLEWEIAPGRGEVDLATRRLDLGAEQ